MLIRESFCERNRYSLDQLNITLICRLTCESNCEYICVIYLFSIWYKLLLCGAAYCVALCLSVRPVIVAIGNVFSSTASVMDVLFGTH